MIYSYLKTVFAEAEYIPAQNGTEAIEKYDELQRNGSQVSLFFLDYLMPDMDGISVAEKLMEMNSDAFIIMVTSNLQTPVRDKAHEVGIKGFFNKPLKKTDLFEIKKLWDEISPQA